MLQIKCCCVSESLRESEVNWKKNETQFPVCSLYQLELLLKPRDTCFYEAWWSSSAEMPNRSYLKVTCTRMCKKNASCLLFLPTGSGSRQQQSNMVHFPFSRSFSMFSIAAHRYLGQSKKLIKSLEKGSTASLDL